MDEAEYREKLSIWTAAERFAVIAEEMLRFAIKDHMERGGPPASDEIKRIARERRAEADALFQELFPDIEAGRERGAPGA